MRSHLSAVGILSWVTCDLFIKPLLRSWNVFCTFLSTGLRVSHFNVKSWVCLEWSFVWGNKRNLAVHSSTWIYHFPSTGCRRGYHFFRVHLWHPHKKSDSWSYVNSYSCPWFHSLGLCVCFVQCHAVLVTALKYKLKSSMVIPSALFIYLFLLGITLDAHSSFSFYMNFKIIFTISVKGIGSFN